jgi:uncharacterized membrane protein YcfT
MAAIAVSPTPNRLLWADVARGLCIVLVVMMHSTLGVQEAMDANGWLNPVIEFAKPFRIPAFFLVAGLFFAPMLTRSWPDLINRRLLRLAYVLALWSLLLFVAKGGFLALESLRQGARWFLLALLEPPSALWFIHALILFSLAARLLAGLPGWLVLAAAATLHLAAPVTGWTAIDEFASRFVFFVLGCQVAGGLAAFAAGPALRRGLAFGIVALALVINAAAVWPAAFGLAALPALLVPLQSLLLGVTGTLALVVVAVHLALGAVGRALAYAGTRSLAIYVSFTVPMAVMRILLVKSGLIADVGLVSLLVTGAALLAPLVFEAVARRFGLSLLFDLPRAKRSARPSAAVTGTQQSRSSVCA